MGQAQSDEHPRRRSREELSRELVSFRCCLLSSQSFTHLTHAQASRFADKCFTPLELYSFKDVFKSLADDEAGLRYLREDTIARFLEIPDILGASPVIFQMMSFLGAFPFVQDAPAVLGIEQMVMVIVILTERYKRILTHGATDRTRLLFRSLAVYDRFASRPGSKATTEPGSATKPETPGTGGSSAHPAAFAVDSAGYGVDDDADDGEDDDLTLAALESLDIDKAVRQGDAPTGHGAMIPADNFRKLIMLLLLVAPLGAQESLSQYTGRVAGQQLQSLRATAEHILASFLNVEESPGIRPGQFSRVVPICFPFLFSGFNGLFEHFLFSNALDFSKVKREGAPPKSAEPAETAQPLLLAEAEIMNFNVVSQLSFFLPGSSLFRRLRLLYSGNEAGFSMGSFESKVFNWRAPTILLVRGTRIDDVPQGGQEAAFAASIPSRRFPHGSKTDKLTFGVYVSQPWKHTHRECFGDADTVLFQLEPVHDVFPASVLNRDYVTFTRPPGNVPCVAVGCPHPRPTQSGRRQTVLPLGAVGLLIDSSFEFAVFNHDFSHKGGAFRTSEIRQYDFQDRFEIESLEVWGCGGDAEARLQAERWAWEAREAEARRKINLGTGDVDADRALLQMAGLIGANRSGGSMA